MARNVHWAPGMAMVRSRAQTIVIETELQEGRFNKFMLVGDLCDIACFRSLRGTIKVKDGWLLRGLAAGPIPVRRPAIMRVQPGLEVAREFDIAGILWRRLDLLSRQIHRDA